MDGIINILKLALLRFKYYYMNYPIIDSDGIYRKERYHLHTETCGEYLLDMKEETTHCQIDNYKKYHTYKWGANRFAP